MWAWVSSMKSSAETSKSSAERFFVSASLAALEQAAVHQETQTAGVDQEAGAGDFASGAEKADAHGRAFYGAGAGGHSHIAS